MKEDKYYPQPVAESLQNHFGSHLLCAFAHGACLLEGFDPKHTRRDISLVLDRADPESLPDFKPLWKALHKANAQIAFLWSLDSIPCSTDTFPLEFLHLANRHEILVENAPFPWLNYSPDPRNLRLQCERELRGLFIYLQREVILASHDLKSLRAVCTQTQSRFLPVFFGIYWLMQNGRYPESIAHCLEFIDSQWQLGNLFPRLASSGQNLQELRWLASDYISSIEKIIKSIDRWEIQA